MTPPFFRSSASRSAAAGELRPGDHVLVRRHGVLYTHHGVMVEEGRIIHYTDEAGIEAKLAGRVVETSLEEFLKGSEPRVREHARRLEPDEAVRRARQLLNEEKYSLVFNNCEHFASWCVTGRSKSLQVRRFLAGSAAVAVTAFGVLGRLRGRGYRTPGA